MVHFVGAGCGAPDLITVRGQRLLKEADVIIYAGSLVNPALLENARADCKVYNSAFMTLEEVFAAMCEAQAAGKTTVRLHTGDVSLYSAIREQMALLREEGISYDVTPGVSAMSGAAAALEAEYTLPGISQTVIVTRMPGRTPVKEDISRLASHQVSMVFFLCTGLLRELREQLFAGGCRPDMPAALVYKASWPEEKIVRGTVEHLPQMAEENGITKTAIVLVGDFLGDAFERSKLYDPGFTHEFREAQT